MITQLDIKETKYSSQYIKPPHDLIVPSIEKIREL